MKVEQETLTGANAALVLAQGIAAIRGGDCVMDFGAVRRCDTAAVACALEWVRCARAAGRRMQWVDLPQELVSLGRLYNVEALILG